MRILPRFTWPRFRSQRKSLRRLFRSLSVASIVLGIEILVFLLFLLLISTGNRSAFLDGFGHRADVLAALSLLVSFVIFHSFVSNKLISRIERYFFPEPYQERGIFFSLGQQARAAENIEQLYTSIVRRIAESLESENVSLLVRNERSGDYVCRASSAGEPSTVNQNGSQINEKALKLKLAREAFVVKRLNHLSTPLVIDEKQIDIWARALINAPDHVRQSRMRERETLRLLKSHLLVQIRTRDQLVGILSLGLRRGHFGYSNIDRETLMSVAAQLALIIENSRLAERMVVQERLKRELMLAAQVQRRLLPTEPPQQGSLELAGFCEPAHGVGGDYYDFISVDNEGVGVAIADVAGKGMPAALLMSTVQATLRSLTATNGFRPPSQPWLVEMVGKLNDLIFNSTSGEHYVTLFYGFFDQGTRCLTYVNAGHNPPLFLRPTTTVDISRLNTGGLIAGVFEHCDYEQETFQMQSNDLIFLYTDGLSEALNPIGEEFSEARIQQTLTECAQLSVEEIRDRMVRRVKEWCSTVPLSDDLTFVIMKVK